MTVVLTNVSVDLPTRLITAAEFQADKRFSEDRGDATYELCRGRVIEMSRAKGRHGIVAITVAAILREWARRNDHVVLGHDTGLLTARDPDSLRGADAMVYLRDQLSEVDLSEDLDVPPRLCVEVRSPSDRRGEVMTKIGEYLDMGVPLVWLVDPSRLLVEVFAGDDPPLVLREGESLGKFDSLPGFGCEVTDLFSDLPG